MKKSRFCVFTASLLLLLLTGCGMMDKASDAQNNFSDEYGDDIMQAIDDLQNAEYQDGPFENNLESAREYLLTQISWNVICSCRQRQIKFISFTRNLISWMALMPAAIPWKI